MSQPALPQSTHQKNKILPDPNRPSPSVWIAIALFILTFLLYLTTLAPSVVALFDDSLEFQLVTYQLGIAHPTGYPLYTLLGKLFTFIPIGNVAFRVNLMSAVFGAGTVALVYLFIRQILTNPIQSSPPHTFNPSTWTSYVAALSGALFLATGLVFWQQATIAEVYTLNAFFVIVLLYLGVGGVSTPLWLIAFIAGLSLTHHRTIVLLFSPLALYLFLIYGKQLFQWRLLLPAIAWGMVPLLLYLYIPLRGHIGSLDGLYQPGWSGFWRQVGGGGYETFLFDNPFNHERNIAFYWDLLSAQFYTVLPGLLGIFYLGWRKQFDLLLLTGLAFISYLGFNLLYQVTDIEVFFIPNFLLWAVWSGVGIGGLFHLISLWGESSGRSLTVPVKQLRLPQSGLPQSGLPQSGLPQSRLPKSQIAVWPETGHSVSARRLKSRAGQITLTTLLLMGVGFAIFQQVQYNWTIISEGYTWQVHDYGLDMLQQPLPDESEGGTTIIGIVGEMTLLRYFQQTENRRPDIETIAADQESERLAAIEDALTGGRNVFLTRELPGAAERWSLSAVGPLIRVNPRPLTTTPAIPIPLQQPATPEINLLGYGVDRPSHTGEGPAPVRLTLFWQATAPIPTNFKVSARLLSPDGDPIAAVDGIPVHFAYPTTAWRPGEIVSDVYDLVLPGETAPGSYQALLIWYDPAQGAAEVGRITLKGIKID